MYQCKWGNRQLATKLVLTFLTLIVSLSPALAEAEYEGKAKYRQRFIAECEAAKYNENCARFFENQLAKSKSKKYCLTHPDDAACLDLLQKQKEAQNQRRRIAVSREIAAYCQTNQDAPRCVKREQKRAKMRGRAHSQR